MLISEVGSGVFLLCLTITKYYNQAGLSIAAVMLFVTFFEFGACLPADRRQRLADRGRRVAPACFGLPVLLLLLHLGRPAGGWCGRVGGAG